METNTVLLKSIPILPLQESSIKTSSVNIYPINTNNNILPEILFITTFPPRVCGIATYSQDLINALNSQFCDSFTCSICAIESNNKQFIYNDNIKYILNINEFYSFINIANKINLNANIKIVVFQHEFGLYATKEMEFNSFYKAIIKPIVFVFHTVLPFPNDEMKKNVQEMASKASSIIVMTKNSAAILKNDYAIPPNKISIIPHGTHLISPLDRKTLKEHKQLSNRKVLSTFGLMGRSKNIETTLKALPAIINAHPDVIFLVLGKTHPNLIKHEGEQYREKLENMVKDLNIQTHVRFVNEYLPLSVLLEYLQLSDIYLFTSNDPNQAVSGTFSYAISCGCPVISTPIPHAKEILSNNSGVLIDFENHDQLSKAVSSLLSNDSLRSEISSISLQQMASTAWENSAIAHALVFEQLPSNTYQFKYRIPKVNLNHIKRMTSHFGIVQFAKFSNPDIHSGYTLDDNARALIAVCQHYKIFKNDEDLILISSYLNFIKYCQQPSGKFLNYVNYLREFTPQNLRGNLEDSNGRAIWALGFTRSLKEILPAYLINEAENILEMAIPHLASIHSTRAMAFIIKGLFYHNNKGNEYLIELFANRLVQMYKHERTSDWFWFEDYLTYGNGLLPEAMLCAYMRLDNITYKKIAQESLDFLLSKTFRRGKLKVISNKGWLTKDSINEFKIGGEQPIDAAYTIIALEKFYTAFKKDKYRELAFKAFDWFLGHNHLHQIVYNPCTGGCYDGVEKHNVNLNQGAESTVSYLMARMAIERINRI